MPRGLFVQATRIAHSGPGKYTVVTQHEDSAVWQIVVAGGGPGPFTFHVGTAPSGVRLFQEDGQWIVAIRDGARWANLVLPEFDPEWILDPRRLEPGILTN